MLRSALHRPAQPTAAAADTLPPGSIQTSPAAPSADERTRAQRWNDFFGTWIAPIAFVGGFVWLWYGWSQERSEARYHQQQARFWSSPLGSTLWRARRNAARGVTIREQPSSPRALPVHRKNALRRLR